MVGNTTTKTSAYIYLDHSIPVISGVENTVTDWTNVAPIISVNATDFLNGTGYTGSGLVLIQCNLFHSKNQLHLH